jgi:hypothetical protein
VLDLAGAPRQEQTFGEQPRGYGRVRDQQADYGRGAFTVLERARHAEPGDPVRFFTGNLNAAKLDPSGVRSVDAADAVEHRGLPGAVGADQREQFARLRLEADALEHLQAAEGEGYVLERKHA